jgi:hypothetical protein
LKESLLKRARKKLVAIIVAGGVFLGTVTADVFKDEIKEGIEKWLEHEGPTIVQKADTVVSRKLPRSIANSFHEAVKHYIDSSPDKTLVVPPAKK